MEFPANPSRPFDIPKPESGLADWASKIKAMQRQVDADEEAEQKRLEDEIAASRLARLRRSHGGGLGNNLDLSKSTEFSSVLGQDDNATGLNDMKTVAEKQKSQDDALRKLMGSSYTPTASTSSSTASRGPPPPTQKKPESISLAAFMGGRATGPRLNRHTPQQDAHDPTQFEQRTFVNTPHPVFGRGGVAMPGMRANERVSNSTHVGNTVGDQSDDPPWSSPSRAPERERDRTLSTPPVARRYVEKVDERLVAPQKMGSRECTTSTPIGPIPVGSTTHLQSSGTPHDLFRRPVSQSSVPEVRADAPVQSRHIPASSLKTPPSSPPAVSRSFTSLQQQLPTSSIALRKSPVTTPSLARPVHPDSKPSPQTPKIAPSQNPSPAFLRPPAQKEVTPSISRLQGRGFVQSMVKVSTQLESPTSSGSGSSEKARPASGRRASVLDRWQPTASTSSASLSPPASPNPTPMRKSRTVDPSLVNLEVDRNRSLKTVSSLPVLSQSGNGPLLKPALVTRKGIFDNTPPEGTPGLGSATTLIVYKPNKTGESPFEVDELGVRYSTDGAVRERTALRPYSTSEIPERSGKPLIHPTKDRARKPRKGRDVKGNRIQDGGSSNTADVEVTGFTSLDAVQLSTPSTKPTNPSLIPTAGITLAASPSPLGTKSPDEPVLPPSSSPSNDALKKVGPLTEKWADQTLIGIKPVAPSSKPAQQDSRSLGMVGRRALPGLTSTDLRPPKPQSTMPVGRWPSASSDVTASRQDDARPKSEPKEFVEPPPGPVLAITLSTSTVEKGEISLSTPNRHSRIPSTGNRATVMDVALALNNRNDKLPPLVHLESPLQHETSPDPVGVTLPDIKPAVTGRPKDITPSGLQAEKRKSSYEKYSAIMLPSLKEENTPVSTPAGTLSRNAVQALPERKNQVPEVQTLPANSKNSVYAAPSERSAPPNVDRVFSDGVHDPLPQVDVTSLLTAHTRMTSLDANVQTISVDVMTILGSTATAVSHSSAVFYDTEILAIIHRSKSNSSSLASTTVWGWQGNRSHLGEREERKLHELAKRYGTSIKTVHQHCEPSEFVHILGGQLAIRQGTRAHWTSENTAMHLVRSLDGVIFVDEHDLSIKNLCSGFSYCLSILDTLYVWYGCGSTTRERQAALEYAQGLTTNGATVIELTEGQNDQDEMFWMILGDDGFARADYWRWRRTASTMDPRVWKIDISREREPVLPVESFSRWVFLQTSVYIIDCIWELFVLVGRRARGKRQDIRLGVSVAMQISRNVAVARPFCPPVHVLVLPTQLPLDLRLHLRDLDHTWLNDNDVPDHMNILSCDNAVEHLARHSWDAVALRDHTMLPLGVESPTIS